MSERMRVEKMERKVCAVEAEFLGLVNAEGRAAEERNKEVYGTVILLQLSCNSAPGAFFYLIRGFD